MYSGPRPNSRASCSGAGDFFKIFSKITRYCASFRSRGGAKRNEKIAASGISDASASAPSLRRVPSKENAAIATRMNKKKTSGECCGLLVTHKMAAAEQHENAP